MSAAVAVAAPYQVLTVERRMRVIYEVSRGDRRAIVAAEVPSDQPPPAICEPIWSVALLDADGAARPEAEGLTQRGAVLRIGLAFRRAPAVRR